MMTPGPRPALPPAAASLQLSAPGRAAPGSEVTVSVALLPHVSAATATMDLIYDPSLLTPAAPESASANGRLPLQIARSGGFARTDVKFRVVARAPARTQVSLENVVVRDAAQSDVPVTLPPPAPIELGP